MLKRIFKRRMILTTAVLFALALTCFMPGKKLYTLENVKKDVVYVNKELEKSNIFLLDQNGMVAMTNVVINETEIEKKAKELLEILITSGEGESKVPSGFKSVIPSDTKINSIHYEEGLIKIDFSDKLLDVTKELETKVIEAIIYTLTSIDEVKQVIVYVNGDILTKLPKTGINLPSTLDRSYGINKNYDLQSYKNVNNVTVYYVGKFNDDYYYIPVTKYSNDDREKIKIIIDELASAPLYGSNLMSFLNSNTKLLATEQEIDTLFLVFNEYIFNDMNDKKILEEVLYTINLSIKDNYDVNEVIYKVGDEEICKSTIKSIEN